ncbi:MAG: hypothetical protein LBL91_06300 [Lachnospiraceae bacterium]|jgi:hypothetical protein|nr:hypothetical protein [Lachnospiraceae bacterium]
MINLKPEILKKLKEITGVTVSYFYPQDWTGLPAISYYELDNSEADSADDDEYTSNIAIQVDIWAKSSSVCSSNAIQANTKMRELGFKRTLSLDLFENDTGIHHKTMRFEKIEIL